MLRECAPVTELPTPNKAASQRSYKESSLGLPSDYVPLPFFAYGSLRPGQLAFSQVKDLVLSTSEAYLEDHHLLVRDGLPLLVQGRSGGVDGVCGDLLRFSSPSEASKCYKQIGGFEPKAQYEWQKVLVSNEWAWACFGRDPNVGTVFVDPSSEWSCAQDAVLAFGIPVVNQLAQQYFRTPDISDFGNGLKTIYDPNWTEFFGLQAAYLLLWSIVERLATFRYGATVGPNYRVETLGTDDTVKWVIVELGAPSRHSYRELGDTRFPDLWIGIKPDGTDGLKYWYQVRNNIAHRGKEGTVDLPLLQESLIDLHDLVLTVLSKWVPELPEAWGDRVKPLRELLVS